MSNSRSAGLARWMTSLRSLPRPARPAPNSLRMIVRRWRSGRRLMSPSRSTSTGLLVCCTGRRNSPAPSPRGIFLSAGGSGVPSTRGCVGRQSMYFSPIRACGRTSQVASERKSLKPAVVMLRTTAALACGVGVTDVTVPTLTPSIFTTSPGITLPASSKIARTRYSPLVPPADIASASTPARHAKATMPTASLLSPMLSVLTQILPRFYDKAGGPPAPVCRPPPLAALELTPSCTRTLVALPTFSRGRAPCRSS